MRRVLPLLLFLLTLGACAVLPGIGSPPPPVELLEVDLALDREAYEPYQPIRFTLRIENPGTQPVRLTFPTVQRYDFRIVDVGGTVRWRWSDSRAFAGRESEERLEPGEGVEWRGTFEGLLPPGRYTAVGRAVAREGNLEAVAELHIRGGSGAGGGARGR